LATSRSRRPDSKERVGAFGTKQSVTGHDSLESLAQHSLRRTTRFARYRSVAKRHHSSLLVSQGQFLVCLSEGFCERKWTSLPPPPPGRPARSLSSELWAVVGSIGPSARVGGVVARAITTTIKTSSSKAAQPRSSEKNAASRAGKTPCTRCAVGILL